MFKDNVLTKECFTDLMREIELQAVQSMQMAIDKQLLDDLIGLEEMPNSVGFIMGDDYLKGKKYK